MNLAATGTHRRKSNAIPYARWNDRYVEWFTELGFPGKPGEETKAAREVAAYASSLLKYVPVISSSPSPSAFPEKKMKMEKEKEVRPSDARGFSTAS